jgi:hypothetical protein
MSITAGRNSCLSRFREARPQDRVWSAAIAVPDVLTKDALQMSLVQWNQIVQALAPNTTNHPLAFSTLVGRNPSLPHRPRPRRRCRGHE